MVGVSGLLAVGVAATAAWFWFYGDAGPPDDRDLRVRREEVPAERNGFHAVRFREDDVWMPGDDEEPWEQVFEMMAGEAFHPELARRIAERNREALRRIEEAVGAPAFQVPIELDGEVIEAWSALSLSGRPIRYSRERRLLWSIGDDHVDSGGFIAPEDMHPDEVDNELEHEPTLVIDF